MMSDSVVTPFDWSGLGKPRAEKQPECTFWSGRDGQLCVQYFCPESDVYYRPHSCSEYTVVVGLQGAIMKKQLGLTRVVGPGEAMIVNCGAEHSLGYLSRNDLSCKAVSISLDRPLMSALTRDFDLPPIAGATCPAFIGKVHGITLQDCARDLAQELRSKRQGHKIVIETLALRLVVETVRSWPREGIQEIEADARPRLSRREFVRAYEFMRRCRKEDFRLRRLCRFLGTSEERFARLFLATTGHTPASFYNRLLLERALDLLRQPKLAIKEIGFELGFKTCSHFIAAFRREFAVSPQQYRQKNSPLGACYNSVKAIARNPRFLLRDAGNTTSRFLERSALRLSE